MPLDDRLITVAVHTCERAVALKEKLESEGLYVTLQNINLEHPVISSGMRVRIKESDLPRALLIIESDETASGCSPDDNFEAAKEILVPIDFSDYSFEAARVGLRMAEFHHAVLTLLYVGTSGRHVADFQLSDALTYETLTSPDDSADDLEAVAGKLLADFSTRLISGIDSNVTVRELVRRGVPEEEIIQYSRQNQPLMLVMGTRGADKKGKELVGSVTAEVLDSCRRSILTVPEGFTANNIMAIDHVLYFCNGDQCDILAIQRIHDLFKGRGLNITLGLLKSRFSSVTTDSLESLRRYCSAHYPDSRFEAATFDIPTADTTLTADTPALRRGIIAIANKRKNAFARLFNPGMAHRLLFRADIPMMVIPV